MSRLRGTAASTVAVLVLLLDSMSQAQAPPATPLTYISREGRRPVATSLFNGQELIALDDVAALFQATVRDDNATGGATLTYRGRTIAVLPNQPTATVNGRMVALPSPVVRSGRRWFVPVEFLQSALGLIHEQRIQVRRASRLLIVGELRIPRVSARLDAAGPPTRATFDVIPATPVSATQDGGRIVIRVDADLLDLALPPASGLIEQIRAGDQPNTVTIVLASGAGTPRIASSTVDNIARLTIDVPTNSPAVENADAAPPRQASPAPSAAVDTDALLTPRPALRTVVIDPGHGGEDGGARGPGGAREKQLTLDVARRLRTLLEMRLGVRAILTREDDTAVDLDARGSIANNGKGDLFVSLHLNTAPSSTVAGAEVHYLQLDREGESVRQQAKASPALPVVSGGSRTLDIIPWELAQARHVDESAAFATMLAGDLGTRVHMGPSPVRRAPLRVLEGINMPAVLVEMAFLTNPNQEKLATSDNYKSTVAQAIVDAIGRFRRHLEEPRTR